MTYELAKELKEAGFPQPELTNENGYRYICESINSCVNKLYSPTLSELIRACDKHFRSLTIHSDGRWDAYLKSGHNHIAQHNYIGSTPEEAVARLWLALKKYDSQ